MNEVISPEKIENEHEITLRPSLLQEFIGQAQLKGNLQIFIQAAKGRKESLDHTLFYGPPGLGKTTLAQIIAKEMGANFKSTSGPVLSKAIDLSAILTNLNEGDILFIDEIHRLSKQVEEILYQAMEDYAIDIIIGEGPAARSMKIYLPPFTLIGATTRLGLLTDPLRDRFGIPLRLDFYTIEELKNIVIRGSHILKINITDDGAKEIAARSRGTPRIALRLLRRIRDFAAVQGKSEIDVQVADIALNRLEVDSAGLDSNDYKYLKLIANNYNGGPVGLNTIAAAMAEETDAIEDIIEPFLLQAGMIQRTPRGRMLTNTAYSHLGLMKIVDFKENQYNLFNGE